MSIVDSGERREFESGAVRDIAEGKGRCDLLPLDVIAKMFATYGKNTTPLSYIAAYIYTGNQEHLFRAINSFSRDNYADYVTMIIEVSKHYEEGAKKYNERNWEKGIPLHCYIDSAVRHYLKHLRGDNDERHDRAFVWNLLGALWTQEHLPEFIDLPFKEVTNAEKT